MALEFVFADEVEPGDQVTTDGDLIDVRVVDDRWMPERVILLGVTGGGAKTRRVFLSSDVVWRFREES